MDVEYSQLSTEEQIKVIGRKIKELEVEEEYDAIASLFEKSKNDQKDSLLEQLNQEKAVIQNIRAFYTSMIKMLQEAAGGIDQVQAQYGNTDRLTESTRKGEKCLT